MNAEQFEKCSQTLDKQSTEHIQASPKEELDSTLPERNNARSKPPPLALRIDVSRPIAVVCPESEVNTPLFSSVTRKSLFDGVLLDASILETIISGIPLCDDTYSENELERVDADSESEEEDQ